MKVKLGQKRNQISVIALLNKNKDKDRCINTWVPQIEWEMQKVCKTQNNRWV